MTDFNRIPEELRDLRQWVCWRYETKPGKTKPTKVPVNARSASGKHASSTDPSTWSSFAKAVNSFEEREYDGIGFVFTRNDPYIGIDLDDDHDAAGHITTARTIGSYSEISPSGNGIHIIGRAVPPEDKGRHPRGVGVFSHSRFFTMTGDIMGELDVITDIQHHIDHYWPEWFPERPKTEPPPLQWVAGDDEVVHRLQNASNSDKFLDLYDAGNVSRYADNESEADLALCSMISFYTQDTSQIDRIFRASALYREKWERKDYRDMTISRALERSAFYDPGLNSPNGSFTYKTRHVVAVDPGMDPSPVVHAEVDEETGKIVSWNVTTPPEITIFNPTDLGNARRLAALHGSELRYCHERVGWLVWDGHYWRPDDDGEVMRRAKAVIPTIHDESALAPSEKQAASLKSWAKTSESRTRLEAMIALTQSEPGIPVRVDALDADPWLLNVDNGVIDLRNGDLLPHTQERMLTKIAPVSYRPDAHCPVWEGFLDEIMAGREELVGFTQRALGYSLTGDVGERALFILHGAGRNGKSTLLETVNTVLGDYAMRSPADLLIAKRGDSGIPNDVARLPGVRFTFASETNEFARIDEAKVKDLVGGDTLSARFMRGEFFQFQPEFKLWLGTNHRPTVRGTDEAIWDRIKLIPFDVRIPAEKVDRNLKAKLWEERSGILNWMLEGCLAWRAHGLGEPQAVTDAVRSYRETMDMIGAFISEECVVKEGSSEGATSLYKAYREWSEANGERPISQRMFGMRLVERGFSSRKYGHKNAIHYFGIRLKLGSDSDHPVYDHIEETY